MWSLTIEADSAVSLNFIFKDFHLPENAELFIVNHDNSIVYGPVTSHSISNEKHFLTDIIPDSRATILLYEPFSSQGLSSLTINKVIYGYNSVLFNQENRLENPTDSCQIDVPCYPSCEPEAKAVALVLSADGEWCCSGSLVMSTDLSFKPYFLTAFRCIDSDNNGVLSETEISDAQNWMFKFNYIRTTCGSNSIRTPYTYNGSIFRAAYYTTGFALLEINQNLPKDGRHLWLGWDRTNNTPSRGICIHHPIGDVMKVAIDVHPLSTQSWHGNGNQWQSDFDAGTVLYGSIGAAFLNNEKKVVGQLNGDPTRLDFANFCNQPRGYFGKFSLSWTGDGLNNNKRLNNWLDPNGTGIDKMPSSSDFEIVGQKYIYNNSCIYSLSSLPTTMSVHWVLTGINAANFVVENNTPSTNMCRITRIDGAEFSDSDILTISAQVFYGSTLIGTVSRQVRAPFINGPMVPCGLSTYYVYSLPENHTVEWEADGDNLEEDQPPYGFQPVHPYSYIIIHNANESHYGTLTAKVKYGNAVQGVLHKTIDTSGGFSGTWYQQATPTDTINSSPKTFHNNSMLFFIPGRMLYLQSDHFIGATVTHTQTGVMINGWSNNNGVISFTPYQPSGTFGNIIIEGSAQSGCKKYKLMLITSASLLNNSILLSLKSVGNSYDFSICQDDESKQEKRSDITDSKDWRLTIMKIDSAKKVFDETVKTSSKTVNVSGWIPGFYIAIAQINGQYYTLKFSIGE